MKLKYILLSATLALSLVACTSPRNTVNTNANHDIVQIADLTLKLKNHGLMKEGSAGGYGQQVQEIYDSLEEDQVMYMMEAEIISDNYDHILDFSATDSAGKEIRPAYLTLNAGDTEIVDVFFVIDKETEIATLNSIIEKDGAEYTHSFTITDTNSVEEANENQTSENQSEEVIDRIVLNTLNPTEGIHILIHESSTWDEDMLTDNEKSTLKSHLTSPDKSVLRLEYTIDDDRAKPREIDRMKKDYDTDLIRAYILYKDGTKVEPVLSRAEATESSKETYNKDYFIVENTDDIEDIYFDLDINNEKLEPMGIGYGYDK